MLLVQAIFRQLLLLAALSAAFTSARSLEIQLSPSGPVASLASARDAVRAARAGGDRSPARVVVADGAYLVSEPVVFEPRDSNVSYEAAPSAHPVFAGGRRVDGFAAGPNGIWTAHVDPAWHFEALWVNGKRAIRARTPNLDPDGLPAALIQGIGQPTEPIPGTPLKGDAAHALLQVAPQDIVSLRGLTPDELRDVEVCDYHSWSENHHRLAAANMESGTLQCNGGGGYGFFEPEAYQRIHLENYRAALDASGEWFLARDGTLSYIPRAGEIIQSAVVWAPVASGWISIKGEPEKSAFVEQLQFKGLAFSFQSYRLPDEGVFNSQAEVGIGAAIEADGARGLAFDRCEFAHTMTNAIWLRHGCHDTVIRHCWIHDLGAGGVKIGDPGVPGLDARQTDTVTVEDCIIHTGGRYFGAGVGVIIFHSHDCAIRQCDIADFFYTGVSIGWVWGYHPTACARNVVEACEIHHLGWALLSDMGAVYTLGPQPGTVIRDCHFHDIGAASYGGWGMYNDEGSTGIAWQNNLVHDTQDAGYHQHYGRGNIVRNNIIAFCREEHVRRSKPEDFFAFTFDHNIVLLGEGKLFAQLDGNWQDGRVCLTNNVYWRPGGKIADFAGKSWADWQFMGNDVNSLVTDPLFVDAARGDWSLRPESPALKLGFVPFDWRKAGVISGGAWRQLASEAFPAMRFGGKPALPALQLRDGFETTPLGGKPAQARESVTKRDSIAVVEGGASKGRHCLQLTDGPDIVPAFDPHFFYTPHHTRGVTRVAFDVRAAPEFHLIHEWRDDSQPYRTGPMLEFENGEVRTGGRKLAVLPAGAWMHVEITAKLGVASDGKWSCTLSVPGREPQIYADLAFVNKEMKGLDWLGFVGAGTAASKCWLDEIEIENH